MMMRPRNRLFVNTLLIFPVLLLVACSGAVPLAGQPTAAQTVIVVATPTATAVPATLTTLTALNVRTGPGTTYEVIQVLDSGATATIIGRNSDTSWWQLDCSTESCWVSANSNYSTTSHTDNVPVTDGSTTMANTDSSTSSSTREVIAATTEATEAATAEPTATATSAPAAASDGDSLQDPAVYTAFTPANGSFSYSNDISYENGDQEDWVSFELPNSPGPNASQPVWVTLTCTITGDSSAGVRATLYENQSGTGKFVACNAGETELIVTNTAVQQLQIHFNDPKPDTYVSYTITVVGIR